jgi:magnesium chelatase family protein
MAMAAAKQRDLVGIVVSAESAGEAAVVEEIDVIAVDSLNQAVAFFAGHLEIEPSPSRLQNLFEEHAGYEDDFADVRGREMAKRALTIAAAGGHNILML